jgi:hypothetical protein
MKKIYRRLYVFFAGLGFFRLALKFYRLSAAYHADIDGVRITAQNKQLFRSLIESAMDDSTPTEAEMAEMRELFGED